MFKKFYRTLVTKKINLFENNFEVLDIDLVSFKQRTLLKNDKQVSLYSNNAEINKEIITYFEIIYNHEKLYSFIVYHTTSESMAEQYYGYFKNVLNNLSKSITIIKATAFENLKLIMNSLKINPNWTSTHVAARIGLEMHFKKSRETALQEINSQMKKDLWTPLHLAINNEQTAIVRTILELNPNLNLIDSKGYSVLHRAALSKYEIFCLILNQPDMFNRILWKNHNGSTALHLACFAQKYQNVIEFLKFGLTVQMLNLAPPKIRNTMDKEKSKTQKEDKSQTIVRFTEQDLLDIDYQDIAMAGSPLHWVLHRRLMEKLISYGFKLNIRNMNGDTPLHVMTKQNRLRCVITLLCAGANVNAQNKFGNTPLHHAIKSNEIILTQTLIVFDANINAVNKINESVRHLAAKESNFPQQVILYLMSSIGAKRCDKNVKNCTPGCSADGNFEGRYSPALFELTDHFESFFSDIKNELIFEQEMKKNPTEEELKNRVNMLTLDGGGIKGLVILQVLMEFEKHLDRPIIDYFQWIAGTSTGSFITAFLVIGKTLTQIRSIYFQFKDKVFVGDRPYDAESLESLVKEIVGIDLKMQDLKNKYHKNVLFPAVLFDRVPMKLHLFRSYESYQELLRIPDYDPGFTRQPSREQLVWKACRASGSAPTYFKSFGPFIDGGLMANNPTLDALTEFEFHNKALNHVGRQQECKQLNFVLSLGTGRQQIEESKAIDISAFSLSLMELNNQIRYTYQMVNLLLYEICNTDNHVVNRAEAFCSAMNTIYFRVNPLFNKLIELDETLDFKIINILWETKRFMYLKRYEVARIVEYLKKFTYFPTQASETLESENSNDSKSKETLSR